VAHEPQRFVHRRAGAVQIGQRRPELAGDQPRPHPQRDGETGPLRRADHQGQHEHRVLQHDFHDRAESQGFAADLGGDRRRPGAGDARRRQDPARPGLLFAGTEFGVYVAFDDGAAWQPLQLNLPVVPIPDLAFKPHDLVAATPGRAFWILNDITPLEQLTDEIARGGNHLFTPRDAVRFQGPGFTPERALTGVGTNPPNGAIIYAYFKGKPEAEATLEILDARDSLVRRISSRPKEGQDTLKVEAGLNRFVWDLRYADAHRFKGLVFWAGGTRGPLAPPGVYRVRLSVGAWSETQPFTVVKDPRVAATAEDLRKQVDLRVRIRDSVSAANDAVQEIAELKDQVDAVAKRARALPEGKGAALARQGDSLKSKLAAVQ